MPDDMSKLLDSSCHVYCQGHCTTQTSCVTRFSWQCQNSQSRKSRLVEIRGYLHDEEPLGGALQRQRARRGAAKVEEVSDDDDDNQPAAVGPAAANTYLDMLFPQPSAAKAAAVDHLPAGLPWPGQSLAPGQALPAAAPQGTPVKQPKS